MPTQLYLGDVARLVEELLQLGRSQSSTSVEEFQRLHQADFRSMIEGQRASAETIAFLLEHARHGPSDRVRNLGLGTLEYACREATAHPARAKFALRFGVSKIREASTGEASIGTIGLSRETEQLARELFELAKNDHSFSDSTLRSAVERFSTSESTEPRLFARLKHELQFLLNVLQDPSASVQHRASARGALTYFAEVADAIPDDLGLIGLLDDAFVVQQAVREIRPERAVLGEIIEEISNSWPFLQDLCFVDDVRRSSEFFIVNCGILLNDLTNEGNNSVALVLGEHGPLPFLLAFVWALGRVGKTLANDPVDFALGTVLENLETGARVKLVDFGKAELVGHARVFTPCDRTEATHVKLEQASGATIPPIPALRSYRRAARSRLRGTGTHRITRIELGPLEKLFCSVDPIRLPPATDRVLLVAPLGECRDVAERLTLFGVPLVDVIPVGQGACGDDGTETTTWTKRGPGGDPWVVIVRTLGEAVDILETDASFVQVICLVRPGTMDAAGLHRISERSIPVIALVAQFDAESASSLLADDFRFWSWNPKWLSALVWEERMPNISSEVAVFENHVKRSVNAATRDHVLRLPELEKAFDAIRILDTKNTNRTDESLDCFLSESYGVFVGLCRQLVPACASEIDSKLDGLRAILRANANYWADLVVDCATSTIDSLRNVAEALACRNPKRDALVEWARNNPDGIVIGTKALEPILARCCQGERLTIASGLDWRKHQAAVLVPSWLGRRRMDRLLHPVRIDGLTLLLYQPEALWCDAARQRHLREESAVQDAVIRKPAFRAAGRGAREVGIPPQVVKAEIEIEDRLHAIQESRLARLVAHQEDQELVDSRLVQFEGGAFALFAPDHRVQVVTPTPTPALKGMTVENLEPGMLALFVRDSDRDVIWDEVNRCAPSHLRESTLLWRRAIRRYLASNSYVKLRRALSNAGCHRQETTLRRWASDEDMIQPHRGEIDIRAILEATRDVELQEHLDECISAVSQIWGLHLTTGKRLAAQALDRVQDKLDVGLGTRQLIEIDSRVVVCTIETVGLELIRVPRALANRLNGTQSLDAE